MTSEDYRPRLVQLLALLIVDALLAVEWGKLAYFPSDHWYTGWGPYLHTLGGLAAQVIGGLSTAAVLVSFFTALWRRRRLRSSPSSKDKLQLAADILRQQILLRTGVFRLTIVALLFACGGFLYLSSKVLSYRAVVVPGADSRLAGIAVSPDGTEFYVADEKAGTVTAFDRTSLAIKKSLLLDGHGIPQTPQCIAVTPDGQELYVTNAVAGVVHVIDRASFSIRATVITGRLPRWVVLTPDGRKAYVANEGAPPTGGDIAVVDTANHAVQTRIRNVNCPEGMAVTKDGTLLMVATQCGAGLDPVFMIDTSSDTLINEKTVPGLAVGVALVVTPDGRKVYVARGNFPWLDSLGKKGAPLSVIDTASSGRPQIRQTFRLQTSVGPLAITNDGRYVLVGNGRQITVIETRDDRVAATVRLASAPASIAVANDNAVYVTLPDEKRIFLFGLNGIDPT